MAKALKAVAVLAGAVALAATGLGAFGAISMTTALTVSAIASAVGTAPSIGASMMTKPPAWRAALAGAPP